MSDQGKSVEQIEADIATTRDRLAGTIDELAVRAQPKEIARRQAESAKVAFNNATKTSDGEWRIERIAAASAALAALLTAFILLRRRFHK